MTKIFDDAADLDDVIALSKAIKDSEIVVHLAGLVGDPACALDENETKYLNIKTTSIIQNFIENMQKKGATIMGGCCETIINHVKEMCNLKSLTQ